MGPWVEVLSVTLPTTPVPSDTILPVCRNGAVDQDAIHDALRVRKDRTFLH